MYFYDSRGMHVCCFIFFHPATFAFWTLHCAFSVDSVSYSHFPYSFCILRDCFRGSQVGLLRAGSELVGAGCFPCQRMAFFRDYSAETVTNRAMDEKSGNHTGNRPHSPIEIDLNSSENDFEMKLDGHYQSDGEADPNRLHNEMAVNNGADLSTSQTYGRRTGGSAGKWGSTFWSGRLPVGSHDISDSGHESRSGSEYRNDEGSEGNSSGGGEDQLESDDCDVQKETEKVPADEMLSDEYYEQDGDDQNDTLQSRGMNHASLYSRPQSKTVTPTNTAPRNRRRAYDDDDYAEEDDDEDEDEVDGQLFYAFRFLEVLRGFVVL